MSVTLIELDGSLKEIQPIPLLKPQLLLRILSLIFKTKEFYSQLCANFDIGDNTETGLSRKTRPECDIVHSDAGNASPQNLIKIDIRIDITDSGCGFENGCTHLLKIQLRKMHNTKNFQLK